MEGRGVRLYRLVGASNEPPVETENVGLAVGKGEPQEIVSVDDGLSIPSCARIVADGNAAGEVIRVEFGHEHAAQVEAEGRRVAGGRRIDPNDTGAVRGHADIGSENRGQPCHTRERQWVASRVVESATRVDRTVLCLAHFKCPKAVEFGELPKTATGKIQKFKLREREWSGRQKRIQG